MQDDKFIPIHNEVMEALFKVRLTAYETNVLFCVWRFTYGFKDKNGGRKKMTNLSLGFIALATGIPRRHIARSLKSLENKHLIKREGSLTGFCKDFMKPVSSQGAPSVISGSRVVTPEGAEVVSSQGPNKEIKESYVIPNGITKEKDNTLVLSKPDGFGNSDINEGISILKDALGSLPSERMNRYSLHRLYQKHGKDKTLKVLKWALALRGTPYAPVVTSCLSLEKKWSDLEAFAVRQRQEGIKHVSIITD